MRPPFPMKDRCAVGCICVYKCCSSRVSQFAMVAAVDAAAVAGFADAVVVAAVDAAAVVAGFAVAVAAGVDFAAAVVVAPLLMPQLLLLSLLMLWLWLSELLLLLLLTSSP